MLSLKMVQLFRHSKLEKGKDGIVKVGVTQMEQKAIIVI